MGERSFTVCDHREGSKTCDTRNTAPCVVCAQDFCQQHRKDATIMLYIDGKPLTRDIKIGIACISCMSALNSKPVAELFRIAPEEIIRQARAHLSAEALK